MPDSQYSIKSCYRVLFEGSVQSSCWKLNWKSWAAPQVKFKLWLAYAKTGAGQQIGLRGGASSTLLAACSAARPRKLWSTSSRAAPSHCGTRCCHGSDPLLHLPTLGTLSWIGGSTPSDLSPNPLGKAPHCSLCSALGGSGSTITTRSSSMPRNTTSTGCSPLPGQKPVMGNGRCEGDCGAAPGVTSS